MRDGGPKMILHMIGNAHLDPVWLWNWQSGVDEALATFRSAADRCEEYPEFIYTRGEAWLYKQVEKLDPDLFERVRRLVAEGRWHITGGQYVQPDANAPTEAGLRRQFLHGRRYFEEKFGVSPRIGYNVDTFGHPATLPDILADLGYAGYVFGRPQTHQVDLPQTFRWRGPRGGEIIATRVEPVYLTHSDDLYGQITLAAEAADPELGHAMCFYGVGNHGGGPTKANIEYILEHENSFEGLELRFSTPEAFFEAILPQSEKLPVVTEELQRTFPGCYSVMHDIKQNQRRGEHLLEQAGQLVEKLCRDAEEKERLHERLDEAWEDLLFTQFHDLLAGTSTPSAWDSVRAMQGRARITGEEVVVETTRRWARRNLPPANYQQLVLINPDSSPWEGLVEAEPFLDFDVWGERWLSDLEGNPIDFQPVQPDTPIWQLINRLIFPAEIPAQGHCQILVRDAPKPETGLIPTDLEISPERLANSHLRIELSPSGISAISFEGTKLLGEDGIGLHLRQDHTGTWGFHGDSFEEPILEVFEGGEWVVEESGPLRARVRLEGWLGHSTVRWTLSLHRYDPSLRMRLEVGFCEKFRLLQMPVSLPSTPARRTDGLAGGCVERRPGPTEWPVQGWSRVSLPGGPALAFVTPDAYSLSLDENRWQWTLLRSPKMAWEDGTSGVYAGRDYHTDQGEHTFDFRLYASESLDATMLGTQARQQSRPPILLDRYEGMDRPPWKNNPPKRLWLPAEHRAYRDGRLGEQK